MLQLSLSKRKLVASTSLFQKRLRVTLALEVVPPPSPAPSLLTSPAQKTLRQHKLLTGLKSASGQLDLFTTHDEV